MLEDGIQITKGIIKTIIGDLERARKTRGKYGYVRKKLENELKQNGIERLVYLGGDLTGGSIKILFQKGEDFFSSCREI